MPKRKAVQAPVVDDSDLSPPPPNDLDEGTAALADVNADLDSTTQVTKKRKTASSSVKSETATENTNGAVVVTQKRTTRTRKIKPEPEEEESTFSSEEAPRPTPKKRQTKAKVVKKEEAKEEEELAKKKPAKKKRKTKEEKEAEAMPLSARTVGHKLFIGAHVSSAGGQSLHMQSYSTDVHLQPSHFQDTYTQLTPLVQVFKMHHSTVFTSAPTLSHFSSNRNANG